MLTAHNCSDTGLFIHLSNPTFCSLKFQKQIISDAHLHFQAIQNFMQISEMQKKIQEIFFDSQINAFQLVALNTRFAEREYLSLGVNMLTNSLEISDTTKAEFLELILFQSDEKM